MPPPEIPQDTPKLPWLPRVRVRLPGLDLATCLVVLLVGIHWGVEQAGGPRHVPELFIHLGLSWSGVKQWQVWQILSYALLHGSWFHLLINVLMLWLIGGRVIHILGQQAWVRVVVCGVAVGGFLHLLTSVVMLANGYQELRLVGISGACYALLITLTTLSPESKMWPVPVSGKTLGIGIIVAEGLLWLLTPALGIPGLSTMGETLEVWGGEALFLVSHGCHFGGALTGWWLARKLLAPTPSLADLQQMRAKRERDIGIDGAG
ncbi:rhomboid family intramembrane serine protease [Verrucomicrobiaceae bacterium R5-34]|nr:rhomboid family intramembrane serine protease [Verrucomicrobiaceae bacterium R5-34]